MHFCGKLSWFNFWLQILLNLKFTSGTIHLEHKKEYGGLVKEFSAHVVGEIYSKVSFGGHFPPFLDTKQANSRISCYFLEKTL